MLYFKYLFRYYSNEVENYGSPYGYSQQSVATPQTMGYDISADFVDSTTAYEPRNSTIIDADFIGLHSKYSVQKNNLNAVNFDYIINYDRFDNIECFRITYSRKKNKPNA